MSVRIIGPIAAAGLLPATIVAISMFAIHNLFVAMFLMHWFAMVPIIVLFSYLSKHKEDMWWYVRYLAMQEVKSIIVSFFGLFTLGCVVPVLSYMAASCRTAEWGLCIGPVTDNIAEFGFKEAPTWLIVACAIYFPVVNPLIEEMFWRVCMNHESRFASEEDSREESATLIEEGVLSRSSDPDSIVGVPKEINLHVACWPLRILFSVLYASYHTMVVGVFLGGVRFGILAFFLLTALGLIFQEIFAINTSTQGFYKAVFFHIGVDLGVVIALGDALGWYTLI